MTHLSIKALRRYHELGLLEPVNVDPTTGYRSYDTSQVQTAQLIRRFRSLEMPVEQVKAILAATDIAERNGLIVGHLKQMESNLERTQAIVASLPTISGSPPRSLASTGTPEAKASITEYGHGSSHRDGASTTAARERSCSSACSDTRPSNRTSPPAASA